MKPIHEIGSDRQFITALGRGLEVLACFGHRRALSATEIAQLTTLSQPTVWRICYTLCKMNFLRRSLQDDNFQLGPAARMLAHSATESMHIADIAQGPMQALADRVQLAVGLAVPDRLGMLLMRRCQGQAPLVLNLDTGSRVPIATTAYGWAYLAALPASERSHLLTQLKVANASGWSSIGPAIKAALAKFASRGYVLNCGHFSRYVNAIAVPLVDATEGIIYSISVAGPSVIATRRMLEREVAPELLQLRDWLSEQYAANREPTTPPNARPVARRGRGRIGS